MYNLCCFYTHDDDGVVFGTEQHAVDYLRRKFGVDGDLDHTLSTSVGDKDPATYLKIRVVNLDDQRFTAVCKNNVGFMLYEDDEYDSDDEDGRAQGFYQKCWDDQ